MSLEMAHKVIVPPKKNYIPQFLKQRDINSYKLPKHQSLNQPYFLFIYAVNQSFNPRKESGQRNVYSVSEQIAILYFCK
jgi:hypothetical protein